MWKWGTTNNPLQTIAIRLSDAFNDSIKFTKSYILVVNIPARIYVLEEYEEIN